MGKVVLSICMHTRKGYSENCTVVMKSSDASVSKLTSTPALMKSMSTVMFPVTTSAPLKQKWKSNQNGINRERIKTCHLRIKKIYIYINLNYYSECSVLFLRSHSHLAKEKEDANVNNRSLTTMQELFLMFQIQVCANHLKINAVQLCPWRYGLAKTAEWFVLLL